MAHDLAQFGVRPGRGHLRERLVHPGQVDVLGRGGGQAARGATAAITTAASAVTAPAANAAATAGSSASARPERTSR
ncbi:hypothetical protein E9565_21900, partial [Blastococcus sp. KM273129]|nr:hypothetical protein [Blastococcus sp. KM273129]